MTVTNALENACNLLEDYIDTFGDMSGANKADLEDYRSALALPAISREAIGEAIYRAKYQHEGGRWEANESKEVWYKMADRFMGFLALPASKGWQDIESAPKDRSDMLLYDPEYENDHRKVFEGYYDPKYNFWFDSHNIPVFPTHWQPLPEAPL